MRDLLGMLLARAIMRYEADNIVPVVIRIYMKTDLKYTTNVLIMFF
jgi:hypothetical protein